MLKSPLLRLAVRFTKKVPLEDRSENLIRAHVATLEWNMMSRKFGMTAAKLVRLQEKSVELALTEGSVVPALTEGSVHLFINSFVQPHSHPA